MLSMTKVQCYDSNEARSNGRKIDIKKGHCSGFIPKGFYSEKNLPERSFPDTKVYDSLSYPTIFISKCYYFELYFFFPNSRYSEMSLFWNWNLNRVLSE